MLRQLLKDSGVRDPLLVLPDGRVVDGVHRLELARALGLTEVPVRIINVPEKWSDSDRMELETTRAALDAGRRRIDPPGVRRLVLELARAEVQLRAVNSRASNLRRGRVAGAGPTVPTQRERGQTVGMSERTVRRLDRIAREAPPDVLHAVGTGMLSVKAADRGLAQPTGGPFPTGPVRARETSAVGSPTKKALAAARPRGPDAAVRRVAPHADPGSIAPDGRAGVERVTVSPEPGHIGEGVATDGTDAPAAPSSPMPPAVESFIAVCRAFHEPTLEFVRETAHWVGERREQPAGRSRASMSMPPTARRSPRATGRGRRDSPGASRDRGDQVAGLRGSRHAVALPCRRTPLCRGARGGPGARRLPLSETAETGRVLLELSETDLATLAEHVDNPWDHPAMRRIAATLRRDGPKRVQSMVLRAALLGRVRRDLADH